MAFVHFVHFVRAPVEMGGGGRIKIGVKASFYVDNMSLGGGNLGADLVFLELGKPRDLTLELWRKHLNTFIHSEPIRLTAMVR